MELGWLASEAQGFCCLCLISIGMLHRCFRTKSPYPPFCMASCVQVLTLAKQMPYWLIYHSRWLVSFFYWIVLFYPQPLLATRTESSDVQALTQTNKAWQHVKEPPCSVYRALYVLKCEVSCVSFKNCILSSLIYYILDTVSPPLLPASPPHLPLSPDPLLFHFPSEKSRHIDQTWHDKL